MPSAQKQQKRAKRAKDKAKQGRVARHSPQAADPIVPDYFMPDLLPEEYYEEDIDDDVLLEAYVDPELLASMDDEEREAMAALLRDDSEVTITEEELLLLDVFETPAPEPTKKQRRDHFEALKLAEQDGLHALLLAFARGPVAAHALYNIDFDKYDDILLGTIGSYLQWAHGLNEETVRTRINSDEFREALCNVYSEIEEQTLIEQYTTGGSKQDEAGQD
ncbi:hypothetical protein [Pseudomonas sp. SLFW]|uniref:hypothetical protein n=1 Tax=Pseudomonas sp. SLFW TaxID=2683259 RepID=UPI0014129BD1|nr:hypothetical protein [Pseudomonas sp. SLFW]NBB09045.1 hypothetical protein [Pseudomonas sp. SLFW]